MTEHEANRYMNEPIYRELVDHFVHAFKGGLATYDDIIGAAWVAHELYWRHKVMSMPRDEVQAELKARDIDVSSAVSRVLRAVDAAKKT